MLEDTTTALEDAKTNGVTIAPGADTGVYVACISFEYPSVLERGGGKVLSWNAPVWSCRHTCTSWPTSSGRFELFRCCAHVDLVCMARRLMVLLTTGCR